MAPPRPTTSDLPNTSARASGRERTRGPLAPAQRLAAVSTLDALAASLRARILGGEFAPRTALAELDVATAYGVARPTARAAIQRLVSDQVLRREPNRSAHVPELTHEDVRDLYSVRTPLELMVVGEIVERRLRPAKAEQAVRRLEQLPDTAPWAEVVDIDRVFHMELVESINSPRLTRIYESLQAEIRLALLQLGPVYQSVPDAGAEHRQLFAAVVGGSKRRAFEAMTRHLDGAVADLTGEAP